MYQLLYWTILAVLAGKHNLVQYKFVSFSIIFENKGLVLQGAGSCNDTSAYLQWRGEHLQQAWEGRTKHKIKNSWTNTCNNLFDKLIVGGGAIWTLEISVRNIRKCQLGYKALGTHATTWSTNK